MKAICIARVSTEEQREAGNSLEAQTSRLERYCNNKRFEILHSYSVDESAYKDDRAEFDRILDFVINLKTKTAICFDKVDRLSRNVFDKRISMLYEKALDNIIELHFVSDGQVINGNISAAEKFQFSITLGLAKYYSDAISDNVRRAQEQKLRNGEWLSQAPFGYKNITRPDGKKDIVPDDHASYIMKQAFELYATGAYSMGTLCQKLKDEYGVNWPKGALSKRLKNPFYAGTMIVRGKEYPHKYEPIINKETYNQVQRIMVGHTQKPFKYAGLPFLYRGLLRCGHCGLAITAERQKGYAYYHCTEYNGKHGAKWLREDEITRQLGHVFKNIQMPDDIVEQVKQELHKLHEQKVKFHNEHYDKLTKKKQELTTMIDNLYFDKLKARIDDEQYERYYASLRTQIDDVDARLEQLQEAEDNYFVTSTYILDLCNRAEDLFYRSKVDEKRQLLNLVLSNIRIEDGYVLYEVRKPFNMILENGKSFLWRPIVDAFLNKSIEIELNTTHVQRLLTHAV